MFILIHTNGKGLSGLIH